MTRDGIELYWIPLGAGAGGALVRWSGRAYEAIAALLARRTRRALYHSALEITVDGSTTAVEMAPVWLTRADRGVVAEGPVGARWLGRWRAFRYEVRCWRDGSIPDLVDAIGGPVPISADAEVARTVLALVPDVPIHTWGRDELGASDMWNSNSLVSWLLARAGLDTAPSSVRLPPDGRAPGWDAGLVAAGTSEQKADR